MSKVPPDHLQEANFPQRCPQDEQEGSGGCCYTRVTDLVRRGHDTHIPFNVHRRRKRDNSGNGGLPILGSGPVGLGDEVLSDNPELRVPLPRELVSSLVVGSHVLLILCPLMISANNGKTVRPNDRKRTYELSGKLCNSEEGIIGENSVPKANGTACKKRKTSTVVPLNHPMMVKGDMGVMAMLD
ncbi:hypothetical protein CRG98_028542 [Punica granatum]|uniref:Uncharacterized protein n=1 Tax=Punica granatum TaxID=22663 RepID=A0A2I0J580_PUNGR|nr:hypothetical protein CRG98_028542 [Punica granatum]